MIACGMISCGSGQGQRGQRKGMILVCIAEVVMLCKIDLHGYEVWSCIHLSRP